jgi:uncharacterized membrane protein YdjX (TVP38/TMEM64 family)
VLAFPRLLRFLKGMILSRGFWFWVLVIVLLLAGIIGPFLIWGARFDAALSLSGARDFMAGYGSWAWLAGVLLLVSDIVLPVPSTIVMSALGLTYGWFLGGLLASLGSFASGLVAYGLCRALGRPAALWISGHEGLAQGDRLFEKQGGWLVAVSRWMPVLPEAIACLAGLVRMPWANYVLALACGSVPVGFAFAAIGAVGSELPGLAIGLSALLPILLWLLARHFLVRRG